MNLDPAPTSARSKAPEEEAALWRAFKADGSSKAREKLFMLYLPLSRQIARRHFFNRRGGDIELPDLNQLASAGLLEALDGYDPDRGVPFSGYARRRIAGSVLDGIAKTSELREQLSFRNRMRTERIRSLGEADPDGLSADEAMRALIDLTVGLALGFMLEENAFAATDETASRETSAYESLAWKELVQRLVGEVGDLPDREQAIIRQHYFNALTFDQIGGLMGITKGRVSQIHKGAIALLRKRLAAAGHFRLEK